MNHSLPSPSQNKSSGADLAIMTVKMIGVVYFPVLTVIGSASNIVVVTVMRRTHDMPRARDVFTALAVADLCVLLVNPVRYFIVLAFGYDLRLHSDALCRAHTFLTYFLKEAATWILVLVTMERFLFARWPHQANVLYRRRSKILAWSGTLFLLLVKNLVIFHKLRVDRDKCDTVDSTFRLVFFVTTLILYSLVPSILIIVFNATLIRIIHQADRRRKQTLMEAGKAKRIDGSRRGGAANANKMLVSVCLMHICLTMPQCIFEILEAVFGWKHRPGIGREVHAVGLSMVMIAQLNNAINGFLYFFSSRNFRRSICHLLLANRRLRGLKVRQAATQSPHCFTGSHQRLQHQLTASPTRSHDWEWEDGIRSGAAAIPSRQQQQLLPVASGRFLTVSIIGPRTPAIQWPPVPQVSQTSEELAPLSPSSPRSAGAASSSRVYLVVTGDKVSYL